MSRRGEVSVAFDCLLNALLGGYAWETISARLYRLRAYPPYRTLQPLLDKLVRRWDPDHCKGSYQAIVDRLHLPDEYRQQPTTQPAKAGFFSPTESGRCQPPT